MSWKKLTFALCAGSLTSVVLASACAAETGIRPAMRTVVTCVYDIVRSKPGLLSTDVYTVGTEKYVIEYTFRDKNTLFTGGIGISDYVVSGDTHMYTNDTPSEQPDRDGIVELDFLGDATFKEMYGKCHLMPVFDNTFRSPGDPVPVWQKIDMPKSKN